MALPAVPLNSPQSVNPERILTVLWFGGLQTCNLYHSRSRSGFLRVHAEEDVNMTINIFEVENNYTELSIIYIYDGRRINWTDEASRA